MSDPPLSDIDFKNGFKSGLPLTKTFQIKTDEGSIAIYDATNVERPVRNSLYEFCSKHGFKLFFIESECNDEEIIERTVREVFFSILMTL